MRLRTTLTLFVLTALLATAGGCKRLSLGTGHGGGRTVGPLLPDRTARAKGDGPSTPEQDAVLRVLDENKQHFKAGFDALAVDAQPSAVSKMLATYVAQVEKIDLAGCPAEFQAAVGRHAKAWKQLHATLTRLPDAYDDADFTSALYGLFGGSEARGRVLGGDVIQAVKKVNSTYTELYNCAEGYGIEVDKK